MACGKPVVGYDIENMHGIVKNGKTGILVSPHKSLEQGVIRALGISPAHCLDMAKDFSWEKHVEKFIENQVQIPKSLWM